MQVSEPDLEAHVDRIIDAVFHLQRANPGRWPTWRRASKQIKGTEEFAEQYAAIAALPEYRGLFAMDRNGRLVKLTAEGLERQRCLAGLSTPTGDSPRAVAESIRRYASKLSRTYLKATDVQRVTATGSGFIQLMQVEMGDGTLPTLSPIEFRPDDGTAWTRGTLVGQDRSTGGLYLSVDNEIYPSELPGKLTVDNGFLLNELASRVEALGGVPTAWAALRTRSRSSGLGNLCGNAADVANALRDLPTPWSQLLWGPPGAGKTYAIARLVAAKLYCEPDSRILLVAPSNLAVDVLLEEVLDQLAAAGLGKVVADRRVLRYGYPRKQTLLARPEVLAPHGGEPLAERVRDCSAKLAAAERAGVADDEVACLRAELLAAQGNLRQSVQAHVEVAQIVATTTTQAYLPSSSIAAAEWSVTAVDEATMVPPAVAYYLSSLGERAFLLAGDPRQLGPVAETKATADEAASNWMGKDIFEVCGASRGAGDKRQIAEDHPALVKINEQRRCAFEIWREVESMYDGVSCQPKSAGHSPRSRATAAGKGRAG